MRLAGKPEPREYRVTTHTTEYAVTAATAFHRFWFIFRLQLILIPQGRDLDDLLQEFTVRKDVNLGEICLLGNP